MPVPATPADAFEVVRLPAAPQAAAQSPNSVPVLASVQTPASGLSDFPEEGPELERAAPLAAVGQAITNERRGSRRLQRAALLAAVGLVLLAVGLGLNEWDLRREEFAQPLPLPVLPAAPRHHIGSGAAPVIPPADFFAAIIP
jgi:hypothetical protein